jgi:hypothetical protein
MGGCDDLAAVVLSNDFNLTVKDHKEVIGLIAGAEEYVPGSDRAGISKGR